MDTRCHGSTTVASVMSCLDGSYHLPSLGNTDQYSQIVKHTITFSFLAVLVFNEAAFWTSILSTRNGFDYRLGDGLSRPQFS